MNDLRPTTLEELQAIVRSNQALLPCGGGTKPALSTPANGATRLDMSRLSGIIEYEPGEYTFTAYAGTPVLEVAEELSKNGQYMPFDPLLVKKGATLGGTLAANSGGSGRHRYGGVRDFILGVRFIDGKGQLVRGGGKVVKNAAGFDLPKFMVGSLGRFGVFVDLSFKVFPVPRLYVTLKGKYPNLNSALQAIYRLANAPFDIDALDLEPVGEGQFELIVRIGGLIEALSGRIERLKNFLDTETDAITVEVLEGEQDTTFWEQVQEFSWVDDGLNLVKVPLAPKSIPTLEDALSGEVTARRYSAGGNVAWLAVPDIATLDGILLQLELSGLVLFGSPGRPYLGPRKGLSLARRVKQALDPDGKFLDV